MALYLCKSASSQIVISLPLLSLSITDRIWLWLVVVWYTNKLLHNINILECTSRKNKLTKYLSNWYNRTQFLLPEMEHVALLNLQEVCWLWCSITDQSISISNIITDEQDTEQSVCLQNKTDLDWMLKQPSDTLQVLHFIYFSNFVLKNRIHTII